MAVAGNDLVVRFNSVGTHC